jgi:hypothetical protein
LYYGSEIGMSGDKDKGDAYSPRFPWWLANDKNNAFIKEGQGQNKYFDFTSYSMEKKRSSSF